MNKLSLAFAPVALALSAHVAAHPTDERYETRGECEAAYAEASKFDRERLVQLGIFDTQGAAQRTFNELFACEYDEADEAWYIVFLGPM